MNWKVGDRAICTNPRSQMEGCVVVITGGLRSRPSSKPSFDGAVTYEVDPGFAPTPPHTCFGCRPQHLKPIPDDDSRQVTTWDECHFKPKEVCHVDIG